MSKLQPIGTKYEEYFKEIVPDPNSQAKTMCRYTDDAIEQPRPATARAWAAELIADPCVSYWLKDALAVLLDRDPLDAQNDAELLARVMQRHAAECLGRG